MKLFAIISFSILVLTGNVLQAQDKPYSLTLNEAINYALQHNRTLLNARDQVTKSAHAFREARASGLPQVNGTVDFMTYFNYELNFNFGGGGEAPVVPDFSQPPFDQGDAATYAAIMQMLSGSMSSDPIIMDNQMSGSVQLSQLIFNGQYWAGLQAAQIAKKLSEQNVMLSEQEVKEYVINSYYLILVTEKNLGIVQDNISNLTSMLRHTENMYKTGIAEITDVDQLRITVSQLENSKKSVERAIQMSYNMLRFQLGVAPDAIITLTDSMDMILGKVTPLTALNPGYDVSENINYVMSESLVNLSRKQLDLQNWAYAPTISGFYSYTKKILTTGFDMTPNHLAGFNVAVPIYSGGLRKARVSQSKIDLEISRRNQEIIKQQLETQKSQLLFNFQSAAENYEIQKENVAVAGRVFANIQNKYKQGMVSSLDLTQASNNLLSAENNYLSAVLTLLQAQTSLDKLYNKI